MFDMNFMFVLKNPQDFKLNSAVILKINEAFLLHIVGQNACFYYQGNYYKSFEEAEMDLIDFFLEKRLEIKGVKLKWVSFKPGDEVNQEEQGSNGQ